MTNSAREYPRLTLYERELVEKVRQIGHSLKRPTPDLEVISVLLAAESMARPAESVWMSMMKGVWTTTLGDLHIIVMACEREYVLACPPIRIENHPLVTPYHDGRDAEVRVAQREAIRTVRRRLETWLDAFPMRDHDDFR